MKNQLLLTIAFCFMVLSGCGFIGQAYGVDHTPFSFYAQKWEEGKNGQWDHPEDSTSARVDLVAAMGHERDPVRRSLCVC